MHKKLVLVGSMLLLTPLAVTVSHAASGPTLYEQIKDQVTRDASIERAEDAIVEFVKAYFEKRENRTFTDDEVAAAIRGDAGAFCGQADTDSKEKSREACEKKMIQSAWIARAEERVRRLGRDLQIAATSFELPISDLPGRSLQLSSDMRGIVNIWGADSGSGSRVQTSSGSQVDPWPIRFQTVEDSVIQPLLIGVKNALDALPAEERTAAVWRYQYGSRFVKGLRKPLFPPPTPDSQSGEGTERQFVFKQWPSVESALDAIWTTLAATSFDPPLLPNESAVFLFPKKLLQDNLTENVIVWARVDGDPSHPMGDVGLQWEIPLEPLLPSLISPNDEPILGGAYPPEPIEVINGNQEPIRGIGLCTGPTALRGYLCRPFAPEAGTRCPNEESTAPPDSISLTTCVETGATITTAAGSDVCRDMQYREPRTFDPNTQCKVNIDSICQPTCEKYEGLTSPKAADGTIKVCVANGKRSVVGTYLLYHELQHAFQACTKPVGWRNQNSGDREKDNAACCRSEGEAYRAQCDMMERDGVFEGVADASGIPINAETCAEALTDYSCGPDRDGFEGCSTSYNYDKAFLDALLLAEQNNPKNVPATCPDLQNNMDPRVKDFIDMINLRKDACIPGSSDNYKNRIGNNMCYIGQCVEQSLELHRVAGAQAPVGIADATAPWHNPQTGSPLGNLLINPPVTPSFLPAYRPHWIVQEMEQSLCQQLGLPARSPTILCTIQDSQRLGLPLLDPIKNIQSLLAQKKSTAQTSTDFLNLSLSIGSRMGTVMYEQELTNISRTLAHVLTMAATLFQEMITVSFPTEMCPLDDALPPPISRTPTPPT